jgi:hypothetical protein
MAYIAGEHAKLVNLTGFPVNVYATHGDPTPMRVFAPDPKRICRLNASRSSVGVVEGCVPVHRMDYWTSLPFPEPGIFFIVPPEVRDIFRTCRGDILSPDYSGGAVRDAEGNIIGTTVLVGA